MVILFTSVAGLMLWIILWAFGIKSVVAISASLLLVGIAIGIQRMLGSLTRRSE